MPRQSAGVKLYRSSDGSLELLLELPGGPFLQKKDHGAWSIPKGVAAEGDDLFETALRELREETGFDASGRPAVRLPAIKQAGGKTVHAWAIEADLDPRTIVSNTFTLEWPPRSGRMQEFPEVDRAAWFDLMEARRRINPAQVPLLEALEEVLRSRDSPGSPG